MYSIYNRLGVVLRDTDGVQVAPTGDMDSDDYKQFVEWCDLGNSPTVAVEPEIYLYEFEDQYVARVDAHLDAVAQSHSYSSIADAISYRDSHVGLYATEAAAFSRWRSDVYVYCESLITEHKETDKALPSMIDLIASLPIYPLG